MFLTQVVIIIHALSNHSFLRRRLMVTLELLCAVVCGTFKKHILNTSAPNPNCNYPLLVLISQRKNRHGSRRMRPFSFPGPKTLRFFDDAHQWRISCCSASLSVIDFKLRVFGSLTPSIINAIKGQNELLNCSIITICG